LDPEKKIISAANAAMTDRLGQMLLAFAMLAIGILLSFSACVASLKMYSQGVDPKNVEYVLWAHGLNRT
jgi:hypothetical protein